MVSTCTFHAQQLANSQVGMHGVTIHKIHNSQQDVLAHVLKHIEYMNESHVRLMLFEEILKLTSSCLKSTWKHGNDMDVYMQHDICVKRNQYDICVKIMSN